MEDRAFLQGDEDVPGGQAGLRLRPRDHIRPFPGRVLLVDHNEADRAQGVRGQAAHRAALRFHPRLQGHRERRRKLRQQRDRHPDLSGDKAEAGPLEAGQRVLNEKGSGQPVPDRVLTPHLGGESQIQEL